MRVTLAERAADMGLRSKRWTVRMWALLFLVFLCTRVPAQIVNIEDKRKGFDTIGWFGQLDLGGNLTKNKNTVVSLNGNLRIDHVGDKHRILALTDYRLVQVSGDNALNAGFTHLRYAYYLSDKWRWEAFTQLQYDEQLRIGLRYLVGTGPRVRLLSSEKSRIYVGILYMFEYDEVNERALIYRDHRLSNYVSFSLRPFARATLATTTYYQPIIPDFERGRLSTVNTLTIGITENLSFKTQFDLVYDPLLTQGLTDVPKTNYKWMNGLRFKF